MYTAIIVDKTFSDNGYNITVDFSNGTKTFREKVIPQDRNGFDFWLKSRLEHYNSAELLESTLVEGEPIVPPEPEVPSTPTAAELARADWFARLGQLERVSKLVDLGVIESSNVKLVSLQKSIKNDIKPEYIDSI